MTTSASFLGETLSIDTLALVLKDPLPVSYASVIPSVPIMIPPEGRSGPGMNFIRSAEVAFGLLSRWIAPAITSRILCGAMLVAIPTAIPDDPLTRRLGNAAGSTSGSDS